MQCRPHAFLATRKGDIRENPVHDVTELYTGDIFYITCIDQEGKLAPFYEKYVQQYHCVFQKELYTNEQWLEIMTKAATKANAICQLKKLLQCDRVVAFGDGKNDMDMFEIADEFYAVANAVDELKHSATKVIGSNDDFGGAKWLNENFKDYFSG